ncbi:MAG: phosphotransferase [Pseudomonadota bacterium]|nr:phosphotransferase [Pseudomonadota bacterium]
MCNRVEKVQEAIHKELVSILSLWDIDFVKAEIIKSGLINQSIKIESGGDRRFVLQMMNRRFSREVTDKITKLTPHLESCGLKTLHVVASKSGRNSEQYDGEQWRLLTFVDGVTYQKVHDPSQAAEAGRFLAKFHLALANYRGENISSGESVHNFGKHLANLKKGLDFYREHCFAAEVTKIADNIISVKNKLPTINCHENKLVHGDPKISNFLFSRETGGAESLIDLDTVGLMALPWELGDAFRSWCNPLGEDNEQGQFNGDFFKSAYESYVVEAGHYLTEVERGDFLLATLYIYLELAARFSLDVLEESYFSWDETQFARAADHNLMRARGQISAAFDLFGQFNYLSDYVQRHKI